MILNIKQPAPKNKRLSLQEAKAGGSRAVLTTNLTP